MSHAIPPTQILSRFKSLAQQCTWDDLYYYGHTTLFYFLLRKAAELPELKVDEETERYESKGQQEQVFQELLDQIHPENQDFFFQQKIQSLRDACEAHAKQKEQLTEQIGTLKRKLEKSLEQNNSVRYQLEKAKQKKERWTDEKVRLQELPPEKVYQDRRKIIEGELNKLEKETQQLGAKQQKRHNEQAAMQAELDQLNQQQQELPEEPLEKQELADLKREHQRKRKALEANLEQELAALHELQSLEDSYRGTLEPETTWITFTEKVSEERPIGKSGKYFHTVYREEKRKKKKETGRLLWVKISQKSETYWEPFTDWEPFEEFLQKNTLPLQPQHLKALDRFLAHLPDDLEIKNMGRFYQEKGPSSQLIATLLSLRNALRSPYRIREGQDRLHLPLPSGVVVNLHFRPRGAHLPPKALIRPQSFKTHEDEIREERQRQTLLTQDGYANSSVQVALLPSFLCILPDFVVEVRLEAHGILMGSPLPALVPHIASQARKYDEEEEERRRKEEEELWGDLLDDDDY